MAKTIVDYLKDYSKNEKKITKFIESDKCNELTRNNFEAFRQEIDSDMSIEVFPNKKFVVTRSFICFYNLALAFNCTIIPLSSVNNLYRTNMINGKYDYEYFYLGVELKDGSVVKMGNCLRGKNDYKFFDDVIAAAKSRIGLM